MTSIATAGAAPGRLARMLQFVGLCRAIAAHAEAHRLPKALLARLGVNDAD